MTAIAYNSFAFSAGQDMDLNLSIVDLAGAAVSLVGATIHFRMATPNDDGVVASSDDSPQTASYVITNDAGGLVTISIADTITDAFLGDYYYEVKVEDQDGNEGITNRGIITFEKAIT